LLALKLLLVPAFLAVVSLAGRRGGPGVAGWLAGFPAVTGPILLFLALERGEAFTAQAAVQSLAAGMAALAFALAYARACLRLRWPGALACAFAVWFAVVFLLAQLSLSAWPVLALCLATLAIAPRLYPRAQGLRGSRPLPTLELALRMGAGAAAVVSVTAAAEALGPAWTGLFAAFPVMTSVIAAFSHRANGPGFVVVLLRAMVGGFYAYVAFSFCVAVLLESWGTAATFVAAVAAAVMVHGAVKAFIMRAERRERSG
jgi:hypothetical protein